MSDRRELAGFLTRARERLSPVDVGLPDGSRRRTAGLRREEVARLAGMSVDYYARLEQNRGPNPSSQLLAALARALRLDRDGRDHLFHLAGQVPPGRSSGRDAHVPPAMLLVLDRLYDVPAQVISDLGDVLAQNTMAVALMGPEVGRNLLVRWFTEPGSRSRFRAEDVDAVSRMYVADLRAAVGGRAGDPRAAALVAQLSSGSAEFVELWAAHDVAVRWSMDRTIRHPSIGDITVRGQVLVVAEADQRLIVYTAEPGSRAAEQLALLRVVGVQTMTASAEAGTGRD
ncbi:transcriptional regulator [Embleya scabrispora]|uniref:Transcriptional regulator n=1 Tax=Embleya scabrispora TaxID=159449 RepID=A0A1T3P193_9ACTN|nr:helix-turn-helix transcriptional regulator [Embleya scabrispora]OPC82764.1 transcriptional regulator [Embleya scabrispora]